MLVTPRRSVASPPPCWCGRDWRAHEDAPPPDPSPPRGPSGALDHQQATGVQAAGATRAHRYLPADGLESEAFDAW
jgi:hypothetical protein